MEHTGINGIEEVGALLGLLDVGVDQKRVGFRVDVLDHDLETIEATSLGNLDLSTETLQQVLIDNAVGGSEEGKNAGDEVALIVVQTLVPVMQILREINFFGGPERGLGLLVHLPDLIGGQSVLAKGLLWQVEGGDAWMFRRGRVEKINLRVTRIERVNSPHGT